MHGNRPADHLVVLATSPVCPGDVQFYLLFKSSLGQFCSNPFNLSGRDANFIGDLFRRISRI